MPIMHVAIIPTAWLAQPVCGSACDQHSIIAVALSIKTVANKLNSVRYKNAFALKNGHGDLSTKNRTLVKIILYVVLKPLSETAGA
jgi:hypothetical protein